MTSISLDHVWVNLRSDPSEYREFPTMGGLTVSTSASGEVRRYAGGRRRVVRRAGRGREISLSVPLCDRERIEWLEEHTGEVMCFRDDRGRKVWGSYFEVEVEEFDFDPEYGAVSLEVAEVTHFEEG